MSRALGVAFALASAAMAGVINVLAKGILLHPLLLAGAINLVSGIALARNLRAHRFRRSDVPAILGMAIVGACVAPALLFLGLRHARVVDASMVLTLEMVFTALLAAAFLRERHRAAEWAALALLLGAALAAALGAVGVEGASPVWALGLVALAALGWGVDNTLSARLVRDHPPPQLVAVKGILGGTTALMLGIAARASLDIGWDGWLRVLAIGLVGIAASVLLFFHALRHLGATRTSAIFLPGAALTGVAGGALLLGEPLAATHAIAAALLVAGAVILARAQPTGSTKP